jgi:hypothetical protein
VSQEVPREVGSAVVLLLFVLLLLLLLLLLVPIYLLARGFDLKDLLHESLSSLLKVDPDGDLCMDLVDIRSVAEVASLNILSSTLLTPNNSLASYWHKIFKIPFLALKSLQQRISNRVRNIFVEYEYNKMCRLFTQNDSTNRSVVPSVVKQEGAKFLQEIILGQSRSAMESS